jgi:transcriptional regulator with XRE-family HTH domain
MQIKPNRREWLIELRHEQGLNTREMAEIFGISFQHYNDIETGRRNPGYKLSLKMADYLNVELDLLRKEKRQFYRGKKTMDNTCCYCLNESNRLITRNDGDQACPKCHEEHCEHLRTKTNHIPNTDETVTYCLECGEGLA